jgi:hypothetical protein
MNERKLLQTLYAETHARNRHHRGPQDAGHGRGGYVALLERHRPNLDFSLIKICVAEMFNDAIPLKWSGDSLDPLVSLSVQAGICVYHVEFGTVVNKTPESQY